MATMFDFEELENTQPSFDFNESTESRRNRYRAMAEKNLQQVRERDIPVGNAGIGGAGAYEPTKGMETMCPVVGAADKLAMMLASYEQVEAIRGTKPRFTRGKEMGIIMETAVFMSPTIIHPYHPEHPDVKVPEVAAAPAEKKKSKGKKK
mmetsp:Transcript_105568/g.198795  ORF Transcript_105568/g.198795 Transcript_105568/m.198795 type:complete len:150 (-) Transcript_105568:66-515(-)